MSGVDGGANVACLLAGSVAHAEQEPAFGPPQPVALRGYDGDAMEPFLTRDGRYLLFNNRNDPDVDTNLHVARRVDDLNFDWQGELNSANSPVLDGVPSVDDRDNLYFVSLRAYAETLSTIYQARFDGVATSFPKLVDGVSRRLNGFVNFDAEISADGRLLFFVDGRFAGGPHPRSADIAIAVRDGPRFRRHCWRLAAAGWSGPPGPRRTNTHASFQAPVPATLGAGTERPVAGKNVIIVGMDRAGGDSSGGCR